MKLFSFAFFIFLRNVFSYSELRIYKEEIQDKVIEMSVCKTMAPGYKRDITIKGFFISLSSLQTINITTIQNVFSSQLFLLVDEYNIQPHIVNILNQFSAVFLQRELYNNRTIYLTNAFLCLASMQSIQDLSNSYEIIKMNSHFYGELYHSEYYYNPYFIYTSSLLILIYSFVMIIPKIYFGLFKITDPFQKVWLFSYGLCCGMAIILFYQAKWEIQYFEVHHIKPVKDMTYYLLVHLDSIFKAYTMTVLIVLSNGLYFDYGFDMKQSGWCLILFAVLQLLFGMDDLLNHFLKSTGSIVKFELIQMALELKDLMLYSFLVKVVLFKLKAMEINLFRELIIDTTITPQHHRNNEIKLNYVRKAKGSLVLFLAFLCLLLLFCKCGYSVYMTGILIPTTKMISNLCLLTSIKYYSQYITNSFIFYPKHLPNRLWFYSIHFNNEFSVDISKALDANEINSDKIERFCPKPYVIVNPFTSQDQSLYNTIKIGYC